jgi:hypothetical protein
MNKIIFQIGLLAFFASSVLFNSQGLDLLDVVSRGFLVFVAVVVLSAIALLAGSMMLVNKKTDAGGQGERQPAAKPAERNRRVDAKPVNQES